MPRLGIDRDFLWEFGRLDRHVQDKVAGVFGEFESATHTGLHLEKINGTRDSRLRSIRIDRSWRGIVLAPEGDEAFTLLRVLPHDDAYAWARRQRASVNRATGVIELRDVVAVEEELPALVRDAGGPPLLAHVGDADLGRLGIDEEVLTFARALTEPAQLDAARPSLPEPQYGVLAGLVAGLSPEDVWAEQAGAGAAPGGYDPEDLAAAVSRSGRRIVLVDGPDELMEVVRPAVRPMAGVPAPGPAPRRLRQLPRSRAPVRRPGHRQDGRRAAPHAAPRAVQPRRPFGAAHHFQPDPLRGARGRPAAARRRRSNAAAGPSAGWTSSRTASSRGSTAVRRCWRRTRSPPGGGSSRTSTVPP